MDGMGYSTGTLMIKQAIGFHPLQFAKPPCIQNQQHHFITRQKLVYTGHYTPPNNAHIKGKSLKITITLALFDSP